MLKVCRPTNFRVLIFDYDVWRMLSKEEPHSRRGLEAPDSLGRECISVQSLTFNVVAMTKIYGVGEDHFPP